MSDISEETLPFHLLMKEGEKIDSTVNFAKPELVLLCLWLCTIFSSQFFPPQLLDPHFLFYCTLLWSF